MLYCSGKVLRIIQVWCVGKSHFFSTHWIYLYRKLHSLFAQNFLYSYILLIFFFIVSPNVTRIFVFVFLWNFGNIQVILKRRASFFRSTYLIFIRIFNFTIKKILENFGAYTLAKYQYPTSFVRFKASKIKRRKKKKKWIDEKKLVKNTNYFVKRI